MQNPSCRPCRRSFNAFRPCSASLKLDLREDFKGNAFLPFPGKASFWEAAAWYQGSENCTSRRSDKAGDPEEARVGGEEGTESWGAGEKGESWRGWREEEDYLHMHEAPGPALSPPQLPGRERRRAGVESGGMRRGRGG